MGTMSSIFRIFIINALVILCTAIPLDILEDPIVETKYGRVKGKKGLSRSERIYYAFKGIPYAKPPTGDLRFKSPEEPSKWTDTLLTQQDAPHCLQKNYLFSNPKVDGSEDCLYLNVYTPKLRINSPNDELLPVMVFIHWGGFFTGYSSSDYLGPEYFMDKNVTLVTFNYRLGVLGFLSTNSDESPGNYGLKDQVALLKWVQNNIAHFGGNKSRVTIFGQSAGGVSVNFHMFSLESRNLFHQAISESGTSLALWAKPLSAAQELLAKTQATLVGCPEVTNVTVMMKCLRSIKAEDLVESGDKFKFFSIDPLTVYLPSIERKTDKNPQPFITKQPVEYIRKKEFYKVPWIVGVVNDEGLIRAAPIIRQSKTRHELNKKFNNLMPKLMALYMSSPPEDIYRVWTKMKDFYFIGKNEISFHDDSSIRALINIYTDRSFTYSSYQAALFHNLQQHDKIWFYNFNYTGQYSYGDFFAATNENIAGYNWGVSHCDDLLYLFKTPALFPELTSPNDRIMIRNMINLWTNFAVHGNPTPKDGPFKQWPRLNNNLQSVLTKKINFLNIVGDYKSVDPPKFSMKYGFYKHRFRFWEDIPLEENIEELGENHIDL